MSVVIAVLIAGSTLTDKRHLLMILVQKVYPIHITCPINYGRWILSTKHCIFARIDRALVK